jgi:hypothetical protein
MRIRIEFPKTTIIFCTENLGQKVKEYFNFLFTFYSPVYFLFNKTYNCNFSSYENGYINKNNVRFTVLHTRSIQCAEVSVTGKKFAQLEIFAHTGP